MNENESQQPLTIFNTRTRKLEVFKPQDPAAITMYSCGPTVYDHIHIGNLRAYLLPDLIKRTLLSKGHEVKHVINFTDFGHLTDDGDGGEDKMMKALKREGKPATLAAMHEVAKSYIASFKKDNERFRNLPPTEYARASDYVREQISLIKTLEEKGYAYETSDGVYFEVTKFPAYGKIGPVDIEKIRAGARVETNPEKHHPADFALWKKGSLGWNSKWGTGFPGWHIECTAMIFATLGEQIDIHTGGEDLKYTHHNGEIAQAEAATGKSPYVRYWLHNAHISINNEKFAKSLGNSIRLSELEERGYAPEVYRYWLLTGHYRTPMNFSFEALDGAKEAYEHILRHVHSTPHDAYGNEHVNKFYKTAFLDAINDDLDTPKAIALMWKLLKDTRVSEAEKVVTLHAFDEVLGLGLSENEVKTAETLGIVPLSSLQEDVRVLIEKREKARKERDYESADKLREEIKEHGYLIEDFPDGPHITTR